MLRKMSYIVCVLLVAVFIGIFYQYRSTTEVTSTHLSDLQSEAYPYERELTRIKRELENKKLQIDTPTEPGLAIVGYTLGSVSDIDQIQEQADKIGFKPLVFLTVDSPNLNQIMAGLYPYRNRWEFAITYKTWSTDTVSLTEKLIASYEEYRFKDSGAFMLRIYDDTPENREALIDAGITTLLVYSDELDNEISDDVTILNYSYVTKGSYTPDKRLEALSSSERALAFVLGLEYVGDNNVVNTTVNSINRYVDTGHVKFSTISNAAEDVRAYIQQQDAEIAAYNQEVAETQAHLDELQETIDEIYSHWDDGQ